MNKRKNSAILFLLILATFVTSCASEPELAENSDTDGSSEVETSEEYTYPTLNLEGDTFRILNTDQPYNFYGYLDFEEATGDTLDDAVYQRDRYLEELFNFNLEVNEDYSMEEAASALQTAVLADDSSYDVAFIRDYYMSTALTEGYLTDLDTIPEIQLDEDWWYGNITDNARIGKDGKALFAYSDVSFVGFEGTIVTFFNEDMLEKYRLERPYQSVIDGEWTFDKLLEYASASANLNGDDSFMPYSENGDCVYGLTGFQHTYNALFVAAGVDYITKDSDNMLAFGADNEKFYNVCIKLSDTLTKDGDFIYANDKEKHYEKLFKAERAMFMTAQLKAANNYRDMDMTYGILPMPKWDDTQEDYKNLMSFTYLMCIPVTNKRTTETGIIMDAMSYYTYKNIVPHFYNGRVCQKILRNEESIQMMDIIRDTRYMTIATVYGMFNDFQNKIADTINSKSTAFASMIASIKPSIETNLDALNKALTD